MESESLLGGGKSTVSKIIIVVLIFLAVAITALSISAIVLSAKAIDQNDSDDDANNACNFAPPSATTTLQDKKAIHASYPKLTTLIQNATVWTGTGVTRQFYDILIEDGIITHFAPNLPVPANASVFNVNGAFVTPGLVDMHSHVGVGAYPEDAFGTNDGNEMTDPTRPEVRGVDSFDPGDSAIPLILSGGVTTSLVLPGSGNVMGGEGFPIKMKANRKTISGMAIQGVPRYLKMAAGENPKRVYGNEGVLPMTRMGSIWTMRTIFSEAHELRVKQDQWDCLAKGGAKQAEDRPYDAKLVPLLDLLRGNVLLNVHCYKVQDFEGILRVADEFGIKIAAFHHALEAWKIPDVFAERNITLATFSDYWGFKLEAYDGSVHGPSKLTAAGAPVAFKSDHPVLFAKYLIWEASRGYHYGLDSEKALQAVTVVPAKAIGLIDRIGTIEIGKEGDVVVWDRHPLILGATPTKVFIEGELLHNVTSNSTNNGVNVPPILTAELRDANGVCGQAPLPTYSITGATVWTMTEGKDSKPLTGATIVVVNGTVECVGTCTAQGPIFSVEGGGVVIPGIISADSPVGLVEIEQEENTQDGYYGDFNGAYVHAVDGLRFQTRHINAAWKGGVTVQIAVPQGSGLIAGVSTAFYTSPFFTLAEDGILSTSVALHFNIGNTAKTSSTTNSVSGQFATLRSIFRTSLAQQDPNDPVFKMLSGTLPAVFSVDQADEIVSVLRITAEFNITNVVISGGGEAAIAASRLGAQDAGVILTPVRKPPHLFEVLRASTTTAGLLAAANVSVGIAIDDPAFVRNLRWEAGYGIEGGLSYGEALAAITNTLAKLFVLPDGAGVIKVGTKANFVFYNGDPVSISSKILLVTVGSHIECNPQQL